MNRVLAATAALIVAVSANTAYAQSYDDRARAEQLQQTIEAYDKMKMEQARAKQRAEEQQSFASRAQPEKTAGDWLFAGFLAALLAWIFLRKKD